MEAFGEKAFILLRQGATVVGVMGWQVENLIVRISDVYLLPDQPLEDAIRAMIQEIESASYELQCEASILFLPPAFAQYKEAWHKLGYTVRDIKSLRVRAWQEAAIESMPAGTILFFKQLRKDRILRPL
jgi:dephospho-CoA kinase